MLQHPSAFVSIRGNARTHRSTPSGADQLFSCGRRSQLRHLKRTERSAWRRLPLLWFFTLRRSISLMQSCRALASIKSNIYQEIKRGERERGWERTERRCYDIFKKCKMETCRKLRVEKTLNRQHGYCYLEGGAGVSTGVSYLSNKPAYLRCVCVCVYTTCPLISVCECRRQWIPQIVSVQIHTSAETHCESNCTSQATNSQMWLCWTLTALAALTQSQLHSL